MILRIENLRKAFGGITAIDGLSFRIEKKSISGLIGPNGAGKTTLFNLIMGTFRPTDGKIYFRDQDITGLPTYKIVNLGISRAFQIPKPFKSMTVRENIEISLIPNKIFSSFTLRKIRSKVEEFLELVDLEPEKDHYPESLPYASLKKLELIKAIAVDPKLILLDEPFAGLTNLEMNEISNIIRRLNDRGITVLVIDHNMRGMIKLVEYMVVIHFGSKLTEGKPKDVINEERVKKAYLSGQVE